MDVLILVACILSFAAGVLATVVGLRMGGQLVWRITTKATGGPFPKKPTKTPDGTKTT